MSSSDGQETGRPLRVALVNDYEVIVRGLAAMLAPFADRVQIVDMEVGGEPHVAADVALFDTFGGHRYVLGRARVMAEEHFVDHVVLYTWEASAELLQLAERAGVAAVLSKARPADELVADLERVRRGEHPGFSRSRRPVSKDPSVLSPREQEVLALISLGMTNEEIAKELFLGIEAVRPTPVRATASSASRTELRPRFAPHISVSRRQRPGSSSERCAERVVDILRHL